MKNISLRTKVILIVSVLLVLFTWYFDWPDFWYSFVIGMITTNIFIGISEHKALKKKNKDK